MHRGAIITLIGLVILLGVLGATGYSAYTGSKACPPPHAPPLNEEVLFAPDAKFGLNGEICLAWRPKLYFAREVALRSELESTLATAKAAETAARGAAEKSSLAEQAAAEARLKAAQAARTLAEAKVAELPTSTEVALFIDDTEVGAPFKARMPTPSDSDLGVWQSIQLRAPEDYNSSAAVAWRELLRGVSRDGARQIKIGLGDHEAKLPRSGAEVRNLKLSVFDRTWLLAGVLGFVVTMTGLVVSGWNTALLRSAAVTADRPNPPFSLARVQMLWWFMLTLAGFLFIWLITGQWMGVMTSAVVGLVGISGVSGLAAVAIDAGPGAAGAKPVTSDNFLRDILSDGNSIVMHRVQMFAWTVVLGLIFIWSVVWSYAFPAFDPTLLVLAGVVNGVYLGFKFPENKAAGA